MNFDIYAVNKEYGFVEYVRSYEGTKEEVYNLFPNEIIREVSEDD